MDDLIRTLMVVAAYLAGLSGLALVVTSFFESGRRLVASLIGGQEMAFAWAAAILMSASSLALSEVFHYNPCRWCWFQRVLAYPNVVVLGWGWFRKDRNSWAPALTLAGLGLLTSGWHMLIDYGVISEGTSCDPYNPCTTRWKGFLSDYNTIQLCAFMCFLFIIGLGLHALRHRPTTIAPAGTTSG